MRKLTIKEIEKFADNPKVRKIAVENFLMSMGNDRNIALNNLALDAGLYRWNKYTVTTILNGIDLANN